MWRRTSLILLTTLAGAACSDNSVPNPPTVPAQASRSPGASAARERLAQALAVALADSGTRAMIKHRLDASNAREGKLQFQALVRTDQGTLLASLARAAAGSAADLLADLDAARGLELYLPVPAQRAAWPGDANYLVGTIGGDGEIPVGFDAAGVRHQLDRNAPPATPVLALVPQETDFTRGHPAMVTSCVDMCGDDGPTTGGSMPDGATGGTPPSAPGLYLIQSHFEGSYESWLKGEPEYEYHIYGLDDNGNESVQLACTGEKAAGAYNWDQNNADWSGMVMLLSDADYNAYQTRHPGAPIRIVAWEDDDEACVDHADVNSISALISAVDKAYSDITSGKVDPWYIRGIKAAPSVFSLVSAIHNIILTNDDFIGNAVEGTITGDAPNGSNWVLKSNGTVTTGWFTTLRVQ
jgi:hypothetical protein